MLSTSIHLPHVREQRSTCFSGAAGKQLGDVSCQLSGLSVQGETLATLGTGLDEMMRHVHSLRHHVVSMLLQVVNTLVRKGGKAPYEKPQAQSSESPQPMETDQDDRAGPPAIEPSSLGKHPSPSSSFMSIRDLAISCGHDFCLGTDYLGIDLMSNWRP